MKCKTEGCRKKTPSKGKFCYSCIQNRKKLRDPLKYCYWTLRNNAKRRGKSFELTLDQFRSFAKKTDYMVGKGVNKESFHIDRVNESLGYSIDNIQVLTNTENVKKFINYEINEKGIPSNFKSITSKPDPEGSHPF